MTTKEWIDQFLEGRREDLETAFEKLTPKEKWTVAKDLMSFTTSKKSERILIHGNLKEERALQNSEEHLKDLLKELISTPPVNRSLKIIGNMPDMIRYLRAQNSKVTKDEIVGFLIKNGFRKCMLREVSDYVTETHSFKRNLLRGGNKRGCWAKNLER